MPAHLPRLGHALGALLAERRTAALATLDTGSGMPFVSMVPFAVDRTARRMVLHVSRLAAHTTHMAAQPRVAMLVAAAEAPGQPVHELPRVTLQGIAHALPPGTPQAQSARAAYLARFPDAAFMTTLPDFDFLAIELISARQVAGFGTARNVSADELAAILAAMPAMQAHAD